WVRLSGRVSLATISGFSCEFRTLTPSIRGDFVAIDRVVHRLRTSGYAEHGSNRHAGRIGPLRRRGPDPPAQVETVRGSHARLRHCSRFSQYLRETLPAGIAERVLARPRPAQPQRH